MKELPKKGDLIAGKYAVEGTLGQGGMGAVFEVCHRLTGKHFAVKWLLPALSGQTEAVRRFMREAQVAGRVDHPNVVEVYDVGQEGDSFYMVMELLQGEPLARRIDRVRRLSVEESCKVLLPVMHGLSVAHKAGVIHRDLKPDNIFLCRTPLGTEVPKVLDFGISKMSSLAGEVSAGVTRFGLVMGTPNYMSPEQLRGDTVDQRTDVYALGVILYEMLGGSVPYPGLSFADLVLAIAHQDPKPLSTLAPGLPKPILDLVHRALARDPNQRFQTVEEMGTALSALSGGTAFAADTGDPVRLSASQPRLTPPRSRTPFATELEHVRPPPDELEEALRPPTWPMIAGVGVAAAAVIALGTAAYMLMKPPSVPIAPPTTIAIPPASPEPPPATAAANRPVNNDVLNPFLPTGADGTQLPVPNTVPIGGAMPGQANTGVVDPAGLGVETRTHRLSGSRSRRSEFGEPRERSSRRREKSRERAGEQESDDGEEKAEKTESRKRERPSDGTRVTRFRTQEDGQGMSVDDF